MSTDTTSTTRAYKPVDLNALRLLPHGVTTQRMIYEIEFLRKALTQAVAFSEIRMVETGAIWCASPRLVAEDVDMPELAAYLAHAPGTLQPEPKASSTD